MSIEANIPTAVTVSYSNLTSFSKESKTLNVRFEVENITYFNGSEIVTNFKQYLEDQELDGLYSFQSSYSGSGNPLEEAEPSLEKYFIQMGYITT